MENKLIKWEKEITPSTYSNFKQFHKHKKDIAIYSKCIISSKDTHIFFTCNECCYFSNSVYCIHCFDKEKHKNHYVSLVYSHTALCDCGNPLAIKQECWCEKHKYQSDFIEKPIFSDVETLENTITDIFHCISEACYNFSTIKPIKLLKKFTRWGSFYCDLVAKILFTGNWDECYFGKLCKSFCNMDPRVIEEINSFFLKLAHSKDFQEGFVLNLNNFLQVLVDLLHHNMLVPEILNILDISIQCFDDIDFIILNETNSSVVTNAFKIFNEVFQYSCRDQNSIVFVNHQPPIECDIHFFSPLIHLIENQKVFNFLIERKDFVSCLVDMIYDHANFLKIVREDEKQVNPNILHTIQVDSNIMIKQLINTFSKHLSNITVKLNENDILGIKVRNMKTKPLTKKNIDILKTIFTLIEGKLFNNFDIALKESSFNINIKYIQPYTDIFLIENPLVSLMVVSSALFVLRNEIEIDEFFQIIGLSQLEELAAMMASGLASIYQIRFGLFSKNDDFIKIYSLFFETYNDLLPGLQFLLSAKSINQGRIVAIMAESFGIQFWKNTPIDDPIDCQRWTNVITALIRIFIHIASFNTYFGFLNEKETIQSIIANLINDKQGRKSLIGLCQKFFKNVMPKLDENFKMMVDVRKCQNGVKYSLKPEYDNLVCIFSQFITFQYFSTLLYEFIESNKGKLPFIPQIRHHHLYSNLLSFLQTSELQELIHCILSIISLHSEKSSISLIHSLFYLVRIILRESNTDGDIEKRYVNSGLINLLIQNIKSLDNGILYLQNFLTECQSNYPIISDELQKEISNLTSAERKSKRKIDKSQILNQFINAQKEFENKNFDDLISLEKAEPDSFTCAYCSEPFDDSKELYGILICLFKSNILSKIESIIADDTIERYPPTCQIRVCGHWAHLRCFEAHNNDKYKRCPLDRIRANSILPVFSGDEPNTLIQEGLHNFFKFMLQQCEVSVQQTLAYNIALIEVLARQNPTSIDDKRTILGLIHFLRAAFFIESIPIKETNDPFVELTYNFCSSKTNFSSLNDFYQILLKNYWRLVAMSAALQPEDIQTSIFEVYARRASLLEQIALNSNSSFALPTLSEFIEAHNLNNPLDEIRNVVTDYEKVAFLAPNRIFTFKNLEQSFTDYFLNPKYKNYLRIPNIEFCRCLFCGKLCFSNLFDFPTTSKPKGVEDVIKHHYKCSSSIFTPFLYLTGRKATYIIIFNNDFLSMYSYGTFYTDEFGEANKGLFDASILTLDRYRVTEFIEKMLTGELKRLEEDKYL